MLERTDETPNERRTMSPEWGISVANRTVNEVHDLHMVA